MQTFKRCTFALIGFDCLLLLAASSAGCNEPYPAPDEIDRPHEPPDITSIAKTSAIQDTLYTYDVEAFDPDIGDTLSYHLSEAPTGMTIDSSTGLTQWTPSSTQVGDHNVTLKVEDRIGLSDTQSFTINVADVNDPPHITSEAITLGIQEELYSYQIETSDPDPDETMTYSLPVSPSGMTINPGTGLILWTPSNSQVGDNDISVVVEDHEGASDEQSFVISIEDINDPPVIASSAVTPATENQLYSYDVDGYDPDRDDRLTYSLLLSPSGMTINPSTGLILWTPSDSQTGDNDVSVMIEDQGGLSHVQDFTIPTTDANNTPLIISTAVTNATEDQPYSYQVNVHDPDIHDNHTYSLTTSPQDMTIDPSSGTIQWTPHNSDVGNNDVTVVVEDQNGLSNKQSFVITVSEVNDPPQIVSVAETTATMGESYSYTVEALDPDSSNTLTYSLTTSPEGMTIDPLTGIIQWIPHSTQDDDYNVTVVVQDDEGLSDTQSYSITMESTINKYAIIIGISDYKYTGDLSYCDEDATSWYHHLVAQGYTCWVYGDSNSQDYPSYDGIASEENVRNAIHSMIEISDSDDSLALVFSGHGGGNKQGSSYLCLWDYNWGENGHDGSYTDEELAADFENANASQLFLFLDACYSGGMNEIVGTTNATQVYMTSTSTENGYGWDTISHQHGAWTYFFLIWGIQGYGHETWDMATCYDKAYAQYEAYYDENLDQPTIYDWDGPDSYDHPMEFNTNSSTGFYL
ncbi:MAG: putative Ig domain-containing protein [Chloroflexota bacterium]|nr:putative Ig domain-containing protein [Chloroflexota bacterium]